MASGLQSWVEDHSNITIFNFIAYPIFFKNTMILTPNTPPKKLSRAKILSLSFSFKRAQLSVTHSATKKKKKKKKLEDFSRFKMKRREKLCVPSTTVFWYCSKRNLTRHCCRHVLHSHTRVRDRDVTVTAFLPACFCFLLVFIVLFKISRSVDVWNEDQSFVLFPSLYTFLENVFKS